MAAAKNRFSGNLLSGVLVEIPIKVDLVEDSICKPKERIPIASFNVPVVCVLKSRLVDCLFKSDNDETRRLIPSLLPFPPADPLKKKPVGARESDEKIMVSRVLNRVSGLWELAEDLRLGLVQTDAQLKEKYLTTETSTGIKYFYI